MLEAVAHPCGGSTGMRVLITGSEGRIGTAVVEALTDHDVVPFDLASGEDMRNAADVAERVAGCDAVVHLAAIPFPVRGLHWEDYWETNVAATQTVVSEAAKAGVGRFVFASSTAYYGAHKKFPVDPPFTEDSPNALQRYYGHELPTDDYGEAALAYACSKIAAETILSAYGMAGRMGVSILRFFPLGKPYGPWGIHMSAATAAQAVRSALGDTGFRIRNVEGV